MVVKTAQKYIGYMEHLTNDMLGVYQANTGKGGCTIFAYLVNRAYRWRNFSGVPWCATFVHAVFIEAVGKEKARKLLGKPHPGTRVLERRLKRRGLLRGTEYTPSSGDLVFFRNGNDRVVSHVGIVVSAEDGVISSVEGNTVDPSGYFDKSLGGVVAIRQRPHTDPAIVCYGVVLLKSTRRKKHEN